MKNRGGHGEKDIFIQSVTEKMCPQSRGDTWLKSGDRHRKAGGGLGEGWKCACSSLAEPLRGAVQASGTITPLHHITQALATTKIREPGLPRHAEVIE